VVPNHKNKSKEQNSSDLTTLCPKHHNWQTDTDPISYQSIVNFTSKKVADQIMTR
ncbi:unnamed protein product, partial [Acidithrix sp. C25]